MELEKTLIPLFEITTQIQDPPIKKVFNELFNIIEELALHNRNLEEENQRLRDEINRLKGEHGKPTIKPNSKITNTISSEKERHEAKKHTKEAKKCNIPIDNTVHCTLDKNNLPADAVFKYRDSVIEQDIIFKRNNTLYIVDVYYSPSEKKTYRASIPAEYSGYHGNGLKSFALTLHNVCDVTSNKILSLLHSVGIEISKGAVSGILLSNKDWVFKEKKDILQAGLTVSYAQIDATSSRVCGINHYTQIICNEYFTHYTTLRNKSRLDVLASFQGLDDKDQLLLIYNEETIRLLEKGKISETDRILVEKAFRLNGMPCTLEAFSNQIKEELPELYKKPVALTTIKEAFAFAYYHYQDEYPIVEFLMSDDAPEYNSIATLFHALCWIHDGRYYKKLSPVVKGHQEICSQFLTNYWDYYHKLLEYKKQPLQETAKKLEVEFNDLFKPETKYAHLDVCIQRTIKNKEKLLGVLQYPNLPLHNNTSELGARQKARKRDISLHTMTETGTKVQDAWMTIVQTAFKLGVSIYEYINKHIKNISNETPTLAEIIYQKAIDIKT